MHHPLTFLATEIVRRKEVSFLYTYGNVKTNGLPWKENVCYCPSSDSNSLGIYLHDLKALGICAESYLRW